MNHVLCDGGLCNRLNALIFALMLHQRFGQPWSISWPLNNWCGAGFDTLFTSPLPHDERGIEHYREQQEQHLLLMHENQAGFDSARWVPNRTLKGWDDYGHALQRHHSVVYYNNLLPDFVGDGDVRDALSLLGPNAQLAQTASRFIGAQRIDAGVLGLHIRKTDFGDRVDDAALFEQVRASPRRVFVCSDDAAVNARFATLPQCSVFAKQALPQKLHADADWQHSTPDSEGRRFASNMSRSAEAVAEGLVDLLILSQTEIVPTSASTFLAMAQRFGRCGYFRPVQAEAAPSAAVTLAGLARLLERLQARPLLSDTLVRLGPKCDGGFSLPLAALRAQTVVAIGQSEPVQHPAAPAPDAGPAWPAAMAAAGARVLQQADWPVALPDGADVLCFDTAGPEWAALHAAGAARLAGYAVISGSLHGLSGLVNRGFFDRADALLAALESTHQVVQLRAQEAGGLFALGQRPFPQVLEVTWVARAGARFGAVSTTPVLEQLVQAVQPPPPPRHGFSLFPTLRQMGLPAPRGVLQVGASWGQEMREFLAHGICAGVFIEPLPQPCAHLDSLCRQIPNFIAVQALCAEAAGRRHDFHVASNGGMSSSLLKPANHLRVNAHVSFPEVVPMVSTTLDDVVRGLRRDGHDAVVDVLDLLYMDTQGAEFKVLLGATEVLSQFKYLYFEVMRNDMYEGQTPFLSYCHLLEAIGFTLNEVYFCHPEQTGNALFIRKDLVRVSA